MLNPFSRSLKKIVFGVWNINLRAVNLYLKFGFHIEQNHRIIAIILGKFADEIMMVYDFEEMY